MADAATQIDLSGIAAPFDLLRARRAMGELRAGQQLEVVTASKTAAKDFAAWCRVSGHTLVQSLPDEGRLRLVLRKG